MPTLEELLAQRQQLSDQPVESMTAPTVPNSLLGKIAVGANALAQKKDIGQTFRDLRQQQTNVLDSNRQRALAGNTQQLDVSKAQSAESMKDPMSSESRRIQKGYKTMLKGVLGQMPGLKGRNLNFDYVDQLSGDDLGTFGPKEVAKMIVENSEAVAKSSNADLSPGQQQMDKDFAKDVVQFESGGGDAAEKESLAKLDRAKKLLQNKQVSGPIVSSIPGVIRKFTNPSSLSAESLVREAVLSRLRATLGAQFTENEGERIFSQTFDPRLPESENLRRLEALDRSLSQTRKLKKDQIKYFRSHGGTLSGYQAPEASQPEQIDFTKGLKF